MPYSNASATRQTRLRFEAWKGGEPVNRVVCLTDNLIRIVEADDRRQRPESLLLRNRHDAGDLGEDCGFEKGAILADTFGPASNYPTLGNGICDVGLDLGQSMHVDEWSDVHSRSEAVANR
ncbi:hypothetical protein [Mesorhizobium sp. M4A.F.Ca.ET.020.02.1.1]|uniref:hypothetical protein n=1 Tax=Mesorhizobium sp. M4A.F.Ca.ET.020.02.1.1 TaxID=2496652 RepID=UPI0032AF2C09